MSCKTLILHALRFSNPNTSQIVILWIRLGDATPHLSGEVYGLQKTFSYWDSDGELGTRLNVKIWEDDWLPVNGDFKVSLNEGMLTNTTKVAALINEENMTWREDLIR